MTTAHGGIPRFAMAQEIVIERYLTGELGADESQELEVRIAASAELTAHVAERRRELAAFDEQRSFAPIRARIEGAPSLRQRLSGTRTGRLLWLLFPATVAAAVFWTVLPSDRGIHVRGGVQVSLAVKRGGRVFTKDEGVRLLPGDEIRVFVQDPEGGFLYVLGLDEHGSVAVYFDSAASLGGAIKAGEYALPKSLRLDASPLREALYVVLAREPLSQSDLVTWLRKAAEGPVFPPVPTALARARFSVLTLDKDAP